MDVLSRVLNAVKLSGALFYNAEFSAPWCFRALSSAALRPYIASDADHIVEYHLIIEGHAWYRLDGREQNPLVAGDIVVFPHGDAHFIGNGPPGPPANPEAELREIRTRGLRVARFGGGGEATRVVCGYMGCDRQFASLILSGLPRAFRVNIRNDEAGEWLENSIRFLVAQAATATPGAEAVLGKLSEALFAETLRRYMLAITPQQKGWLAGARDPDVGRVLALMHGTPADPWTLGRLAEAAGMSRSVLAERFRYYLEQTPMAYLTRWRLQLGARMLLTTTRSVAEIALQAGYESEAAFNRAFKREYGVPPARYRRNAKQEAAAATG